jgi:hypothetical protein
MVYVDYYVVPSTYGSVDWSSPYIRVCPGHNNQPDFTNCDSHGWYTSPIIKSGGIWDRYCTQKYYNLTYKKDWNGCANVLVAGGYENSSIRVSDVYIPAYNEHTAGGTVSVCAVVYYGSRATYEYSCSDVTIPERPISCSVTSDRSSLEIIHDSVSHEALQSGIKKVEQLTLSCSGGADASVKITPPQNGIRLDSSGRLTSKIDVGFGDGVSGTIDIPDGTSKTMNITVTTSGTGVEAGTYQGSGVITISVL